MEDLIENVRLLVEYLAFNELVGRLDRKLTDAVGLPSLGE